ncbi:MAG: hypothetical protein GY721_13565 [Deltaproteobacteria bacterium]|jgi:hypothetical protein|nr:hypothetical protein [Deltaproteobacteria bacterium]
MRKEIAPRMAAEVASEEGVECDPLQLVAGLAMKEASSILDDKDHPVGGYFDIPPKEWGAEVMKQLRILGGRRLAMLGTTKAKAKRAKVIENLTISMEYVSTTYLGGTVTSPPQVASDKTLESPTDEGEEAPHVETQAVTFNDIVEGNAFLSGGVEHVKSGSSESVVFDGEEITSFNWGGEEEVGAL